MHEPHIEYCDVTRLLSSSSLIRSRKKCCGMPFGCFDFFGTLASGLDGLQRHKVALTCVHVLMSWCEADAEIWFQSQIWPRNVDPSHKNEYVDETTVLVCLGKPGRGKAPRKV